MLSISQNHHHHHHRHGHHRSPIPNPSDPFSLLPCNLSSPSSPFLCGHLTVPLDYTNTSDLRTVKLAITVYKPELDESRFVDGISVIRKAGKEEKRKTMFVNPGGPGGSGTNLVWRRGEFFSWNLTGGEYDVLGWDPRGKQCILPNYQRTQPLTLIRNNRATRRQPIHPLHLLFPHKRPPRSMVSTFLRIRRIGWYRCNPDG